MKTWTLPNLISLVRILLSPLLVWAGMTDRPRVFLWALALMLVSDFLDGYLARALKQQTRLGSQLDTAGDVLTCGFSMVGGWMLWPERVREEALFFLLVVVLLGLSGITALVKYRHLPSYHTWSAKLATAVAGVGIWMLFAGVTPWVFRVSIVILAVSVVEEIAITLLLPRWQPNVPTFRHALRLRKKASNPANS